MLFSPQIDYVLKSVQSNDVHFVRFWFTDLLGSLKSFAVTSSEVESAFEEGMGFDGSSIVGFTRIEESDMLAYPDPSTFQILPWRPQINSVARMFCDIRTPEGDPFEGDPRHALKRMLAKAAALGYTMNVGPELEFFYFRDAETTVPLDNGSNFDLTPLDVASDIRRDTVLSLEHMGIPVEYSHHEAAPSQHEIDLRYDEALSMADAVMTYRLVVKEVAMKHNAYATFMPKPLANQYGNGMHVHQSLSTGDGVNAFFDADDPQGCNLSAIAKSYIAGILKYAPEFTAVTNQFVNSYKRLVPGFAAPVYVTWARRNRSALVRVPHYRPGKETATRIEVRSPDPSCNPYLVFAVMLGAGLAGIEEGLELPPEFTSNAYALSDAELKSRGVTMLPNNLGDAIERFEGSALMREVLGEHIHSFFVRNKREEWSAYCAHISEWELRRYLSVL
ncbi:MAG: glutamine synthetase family protein [Coriobacteriales bacterium]|jgi:glutamine synthetase|nr:glutamine synthetase family protein [Coriobacteriales bacterium]